ncbi:Protein PHYTOCHROME KINASE SUBSTRATE 4 [Linum perenne]
MMEERPTTMRAIPGKQESLPHPPPRFPFQQKTPILDDSEISIFDAQKYFNDGASAAGDNTKLNINIINNKVSPVKNGRGLERISEIPPRLSSASSSVDGYGYGYRNYRTRSFHATPTASSEASWNSQTGLLSNPPGAMAVTVKHHHHHHQPPVDDQRKTGSTAKKWLLRRPCPCYGKKSVQVEEKAPEPRIPIAHLNPNSRVMIDAMTKRQGNNIPKSNFISSSSAASIDWLERREEAAPVEVPPNVVRRISAEANRFVGGPGLGQPHRVVLTPNFSQGNGDKNNGSSNGGGGGGGFTFPILSQAAVVAPVKLILNNGVRKPFSQLEDPPRDSLEVFRPPEDKVIVTKLSTEGRSSFTFPASPRSRMTVTEDDMASDASSDLFEIESFSTQTTGNPLNGAGSSIRRDSMEDASIFNARRLGGRVYGKGVEDEEEECYEPSEASIEWSVATAEGYDKGSVTNYSVTASEAAEEIRYTMMRKRIEETEESERRKGKRRGSSGGGLLSCRCEKAVSVGPPQPPLQHVSGGRAAVTVSNGKKPPLPLGRSHSSGRLSLPFPT